MIKIKTVAIISFMLLFSNSFLLAQVKREVGNLILDNIPEIPVELNERINQYKNARSAVFMDWLPNENGMLISTRFGNTYQIHQVKAAGGFRNQITFFEEPVTRAYYSPSLKNNGFLFLKDSRGNEHSQIFWFDMITRKYKMLTDGKSRYQAIKWSNDGDKFAFSSNKKNGKDFGVYISDMGSPTESVLKVDEGKGYWTTRDWSPDNNKLLISQYLSKNESSSYAYDLNSDELIKININTDKSFFSARFWDNSMQNIYAITDIGKGFKTLVEFDLRTNKMNYLLDNINWDVEDVVINKLRTHMVFSVNENGLTQLYKLNLVNKKYSKIKDLPKGQIYAYKFHPEKNELVLTINLSQSPSDVYILDFDTNVLKKWTFGEVGGLETNNFPKPLLVSYPTFDKIEGKTRQIPAFIYKPKKQNKKSPVLISIHGGPEGQHTPHFSSIYAYLVNEMNITIIAPNVRGSDGYGKNYLKLDNGFKREDSVKDIGALLKWIKEQDDLDEDKVAVMGGSYGGYMVLASMFKFSDKLKCGVDRVGISNFVTFLENTKEYRRELRRAEYGDERDSKMRKFLESISPVNHVEEIKKPIFIIQGANDPRVPMSESEQMVKAIRENNGEVWYMLAKDEGHGFRKKNNREAMNEAVILFLDTYLLN